MLNLGAKSKVIISLRTGRPHHIKRSLWLHTHCLSKVIHWVYACSKFLFSVLVFVRNHVQKNIVSEKGVSASIWPQTNHQTTTHTAMTSKLQLHLPLSQPTIFMSPASHVVLSQCGGYMVVSQFPLHSHTCTRTHIHIGQGSLSSFPSSSFCP